MRGPPLIVSRHWLVAIAGVEMVCLLLGSLHLCMLAGMYIARLDATLKDCRAGCIMTHISLGPGVPMCKLNCFPAGCRRREKEEEEEEQGVRRSRSWRAVAVVAPPMWRLHCRACTVAVQAAGPAAGTQLCVRL